MKFRIQNDELRIVSRETIADKTSCFTRTVFVRAVRSACLSESEHVREDAETGFDSVVRVPVPNARLKRRRRPRNLFRARVKLHEQRPREDRGMQDRISIPGRAVSLCHTAKGPAQGAEFAKQHSSAMRCVPRTDAVVLAAVRAGHKF